MKIEAILKIENKNKGGAYLFKSGIFWRAYNRSAFFIIKEVRPFKPIRKYMKTVQQEVIYIGFPDNLLEKVLQILSEKGAEVKQETGTVYIDLKASVSEEAYRDWLNGLAGQEKEENTPMTPQRIVDAVRRFPILERTPLETQAFVWSLQKKIHGHI